MKRQIGFAHAVLSLLIVAGSVAALADSHARIVRLSSVEGQVQVDRATGQGLERAIMNTPVVEGTRIVTGKDGLAEVEFENQSALRITEDSEVKFSQLLMNDAGIKTNRMTVEKGIVYLDTASKGVDSYLVTIGDQSILVGRDSLVRLTANPGQIQVAVFKGEAQLQGATTPVTTVHKRETLTADLKSSTQPTVAKGVEEVRFDAWNKERQDYSKTYAENTGYGGPNRAYGMQDLNYYGDFFYTNGYGYVWQPFGFANSMVGWDPYSNGAWQFSPGIGYSFTSAYPWGWLPYHYGSWAFINGAGWAWVPGRYTGQWISNGYQNVPRVTKAPTGWTAAAPPTTAVGANSAPTVLVGKGGTAPLSIPGGRIPPNFASLVPGHTTNANSAHGFAKPNSTVANHAVFAPSQAGMNVAHHGSTGHVFAQPASRSLFADEGTLREGYGRPGETSTGLHSSTSVSAPHAASASASSGAAHK